jgi:coatomer protein complex subunit gamma
MVLCFIILDSAYAWDNLELQLDSYIKNPTMHSKSFDIKAVPLVSLHDLKTEDLNTRGTAMEIATGAAKNSTERKDSPIKTDLNSCLTNASRMATIPQMAQYGVPFKSSSPVMLTESETEYVITCVKHVFPEHLVFQVNTNFLFLV